MKRVDWRGSWDEDRQKGLDEARRWIEDRGAVAGWMAKAETMKLTRERYEGVGGGGDWRWWWKKGWIGGEAEMTWPDALKREAWACPDASERTEGR